MEHFPNPYNSNEPTKYTKEESLRDEETLSPMREAKTDKEALQILKEKIESGGLREIKDALHRQHAQSLVEGYKPSLAHNPEDEILKPKAIPLGSKAGEELPEEAIFDPTENSVPYTVRAEDRPALRKAIERALRDKFEGEGKA